MNRDAERAAAFHTGLCGFEVVRNEMGGQAIFLRTRTWAAAEHRSVIRPLDLEREVARFGSCVTLPGAGAPRATSAVP